MQGSFSQCRVQHVGRGPTLKEGREAGRQGKCSQAHKATQELGGRVKEGQERRQSWSRGLSLKVTEQHKKALVTQGPKVQSDWKGREPNDSVRQEGSSTQVTHGSEGRDPE